MTMRLASIAGRVVPLILSAGLAALVLNQLLLASLFTEPRELRKFVIETAGAVGQTLPGSGTEVRVYRIVADGRILNGEMLERTGRWELLDEAAYPTLVHRDDAAPATVSFVARSAIVQFIPTPASGSASLHVEGEPSQVIDLHAPEGAPFFPRTLGSPAPSPRGWWALILPAIVFALAGLIRPWKTVTRERSWLLAYLVLIHGAVWATIWIGTNEDAPAYGWTWTQNLAGNPNFFPPGYGMFLAIADAVPFMEKGAAATAIQHAMAIATLLWLHVLLCRLGPRAVATTWLVMTSILPPSLFLPQMIQSENVAAFSMAAALYFGWRAAASRTVSPALLSGAGLAFGILTRVVPIAMAPSLIALQFERQTGWAAWRRGLSVVLLAAGLVLLPAAWFAWHGNSVSLTSGASRHLYNRAVFEQKLLDPEGEATARLVELLPHVKLEDLYHWDVAVLLWQKGIPLLEPNLKPNEEATFLIGGAGREAALSKPVEFVLFSFTLAWRELFGDPSSAINWFARSPEPVADLETPRKLSTTPSGIDLRSWADWLFLHAWTVACWMALAGALCAPFSPHKSLAMGLAWIPVGYLVASGFVEYYLPRYNVAVTPFVTATAMIPMGLVARWTARRR